MKVPNALAIAIIPGCILSSCNVGPKYVKPETKVAAKFSGSKESGYKTDEAISKWWARFHDTQLTRYIEAALSNNQDLKIAAARVEEARALRSAERLDYFPTVRGEAGYTNRHQSLAQTGGLAIGPRSLEIYSAGFDATWELDLWGRVRRSDKAAKADVATAEAVRHDTMVSLTAELARAYLELRGLQNQLSVAQRNAENQRETLKLTESLLQGGRGTELDTSRARAQLNVTLAAIPTIESSISKDIHRVSVLTGQQPAVLEAELSKARPLPSISGTVNIGNPAALLRRRPDIEAAEKSLESATERVGVAVADLFPRVVFKGNAAIQANTFNGFGGNGIGNTSFGPGISWAAFDLGRVKAQIDAAGAKAKGQLASSEKVVLNALEETENSLVDFGRQRARREFLAEAAKASEQAAKLARERYQNGVADFLTVLDAERTMLEAQSQLAQSETVTATALVAIYKALGGGWEGR